MTATLKWEGSALMLGPFILARKTGRGYFINAPGYGESEPYEKDADAEQDCMSAVRELLKKEGVRLE